MLAYLDAVVGGTDDTECWPDNWTAFEVFAAMSTQWNVGFAGAIGLRYEALPIVLKLLGIAEAKQTDIFESLRIMESEALNFFREQNG